MTIPGWVQQLHHGVPTSNHLPTSRFPGAMPRGMRRTDLHYLADPHHQPRHVVTAKLDGVRMLWVRCTDGTFLVDRSLTAYRLASRSTTTTTILDGELMADRGFLVFDALTIAGASVEHEPFDKRYADLQEWLSTTSPLCPGLHYIVPKRMFPLSQVNRLCNTYLVPKGDHGYTIGTEGAVAPGFHHQVPDDAQYEADGVIFLSRRATFHFTGSQDLMKWKRVPTIDVVVRTRDVLHSDWHLPTFFTEYSHDTRRYERRPFSPCWVPPDQRTLLRSFRRHRTLCVECYNDGSRWVVHRGRPEKRFSNSARVVQETQRLVTEAIELTEVAKLGTICPISKQSGPFGTVVQELRWLGRAWAHAPHGELELRLMHNDQTSLPLDLFEQILNRLRANPEMTEMEESCTTDYSGSGTRVTTDPNDHIVTVVKKEVMFKRTLSATAPFSMRIALAHEYPTSAEEDDHHHGTRRKKRRTRFLHQGVVAVDCTRVYQRGPEDSSETLRYEVEIEMLRDPRYERLPLTQCGGPVQSLIWRMLWCILGLPIPTTNRRTNVCVIVNNNDKKVP